MVLKSACLVVLCLTLTLTAIADTVLYDNGSANGTIDAWRINSSFSVSDSFTLAAASTLNSVTIYAWLNPGALATSLDWSITTAAFGGASLASGTATPSTTFDFLNPYGFAIDAVQFSLPGVSVAAGTYWLQLSNGQTNDGSLQFSWDQNNGASDAWAGGGTIHLTGSCQGTFVPDCGSEAFYISGTTNEVPEPSSFALLGSGLMVAGGIARRRIGW